MTSSPSSSSLRAQYDALIASGELRPDAAQEQAVSILEAFAAELSAVPSAGGFWSRLMKGDAEPAPSGLYLYGDVGRGKSMLMDLFFADSGIKRKRRVHFHQFMLEIHERLHQLQSQQLDDILPRLSRDIAEETKLLCFDEFHVNNIADAMILGRLFMSLFDAGVVIVLTSNSAPDILYKNGLQRDRFLPFIELIKQKMLVHCLNGQTDHRYEQLRNLKTYVSPLGEDATRWLQGIFLQLTHDAPPEPITLPVHGRNLKIVHAAKGVGFFNFDELCVTALGAADYLAIAECLHTLLLDEVPKFQPERRDEAMRFITLIDALYEAKVKLFMACAMPVEKLAPTGDHSFAFQRTVSRLMEMSGEEYRRKPHLVA